MLKQHRIFIYIFFMPMNMKDANTIWQSVVTRYNRESRLSNREASHG
jgi:hypothetical protein